MGIDAPDVFFFELVPERIHRCRSSVVRYEFSGEICHILIHGWLIGSFPQVDLSPNWFLARW